MRLNSRNENKLVDLGIKLGLFAGGALIVRKILRSLAENSQSEKLGFDLPTQQAQTLKAAFNRSGTGIFSWADGTDIQAVYDTASKIKDWSAVSRAYNNLYNSNLADDLTSELSTDELQEFYKRLGQARQAANAMTEFALKNGFKYKIEDTLRSKPYVAGNNNVLFYTIETSPSKQKTLKARFKNTLPGTMLGKVVGYRVQRVKEADGTTKDLRMYLLGSIPTLPASTKYYVFERDTTK